MISMTTRRSLALAGASVVLALSSQPAHSVSIAIENAGYWLETVGANTIGLAGGGSPDGITTTLFVANTTPTAAGGTTATANLSGVPTSSPVLDSPTLWARRVLNPSAEQLGPLTIVFANGADTATFTGRGLSGLTAMPLAQNLTVDPAGDPFGPVVSWTLPANPGDIDLVQLVFYSNVSNAEVGSRVVLPGTATSFDILGPIPTSFELTVNVRLVDLFNDSAPFTSENILRESRAYVNYATPAVGAIPEPETYALMVLGLGLIGAVAARKNRLGA